jgi:FAD/FMN-containing dehydrogenase
MLNDADPAFRQAVTTAGLATRDGTDADLTEPRGKFRGQAAFVALPRSTDEVARLVRLAAEARVGLVPYGGGTGLVGGQVMPEGPLPVVLSLEKMTAIRAVYDQENTLVADAGATLGDVQRAATDHGRLFPLSYASKDSARIGGALAVNSGGLNVLRYGTARELCLGIEAVLPSGEVLHGLKRLRKDNTGYDLRHLLIGSEGTLGVITAAALKLFPEPAQRATAFLAVRDPAAALTLLSMLRDRSGDAVSAFELISAQSFHFLAETFPDLRQPFQTPPDWCVLLEIGTGPAAAPETILTDVFAAASDQGLVTDGHIAQSEQQRAAFWQVRETIPEANRRIGAIASHDIALPLSEVPGFVTEAHRALTDLLPCRINAFGHLGDGNLHFNVYPPKGMVRDGFMDHAPRVMRLVHDLTQARGGTFSAEHGVGRLKAGDLARYGDPAKLASMRAIKQALDPLGIMNPGALF